MPPRVSGLIMFVLLALLGGAVAFIMHRLENPPQLALMAPAPGEPDPLLEAPLVGAAGQLTLGPIEQFQDVVQRPLFASTRRPPPPPSPVEPEPIVVAEPEPVEEREYTLVGVMVTPDATTALLRNDLGSISRVRVGEKVDDWQLEEVNDDNVVLRQGNRVKDIPLLRNQSTPATSPRQAAEAGSGNLPTPTANQEDPRELRRRLLEQHRSLRLKMEQNSNAPVRNRPRSGAAAKQ